MNQERTKLEVDEDIVDLVAKASGIDVENISFVAYVSFDKINIVKLYPESNPECRFQLRGKGYLYYYCNRHGLFKHKI